MNDYRVSWRFFPAGTEESMLIPAGSPQEAIRFAKKKILQNMPTGSYGVFRKGGSKIVEVSSLKGVLKHEFSSFRAVALG